MGYQMIYNQGNKVIYTRMTVGFPYWEILGNL